MNTYLEAAEYEERNDSVGKILHQYPKPKSRGPAIRKQVQQSILELNEYNLYLYRSVLIDQLTVHNESSLISNDKNSMKATLINVAILNNNLLDKHWKFESVLIIQPTTGAIPRSLIENTKLMALSEYLYTIVPQPTVFYWR